MDKYTERDVLIWLNNIGITNKILERLCEYFPDLRELLWTDLGKLGSIIGIKDKHLEKLIKSRNVEYMDMLFSKLEKESIKVITILDSDYPKRLKNIYDRPYVLYGKGSLLEEDSLSIGIVGSRKATSYGKWACEKFSKELVHMGVTILSGLALGIDTIAHKTAIREGGRTIGVLGNGIDVIYPKTNKDLYDEVASNGMVLTEFPFKTQPMAYNFPRRNRIISGLSLGVVVIEAKEKSGSLITAHLALEQGKDVFALPGNINSLYSRGTNKLIKDGARPLLEIEDIVEEIKELQLKISQDKGDRIDYSNLSDVEIKIVEIMKEGPLHSDLISYKTGLDISTVISVITILELKGIIKELNSRVFTLC